MPEPTTPAPSIVLDAAATPPGDTIVEGPGWRQVTTPKGARYYQRAGSEQRYESVTTILAQAWPGDFSGPTQHWTVADACSPEFLALPPEQRRDWLLGARDRHLTAAADRGSAVHRAAEAIALGQPVDHDDLARHGALEYLAAVRAFFAEQQPAVIAVEAVCFDTENSAAGTCDLVARIGGEVFDIDYKTRPRTHDRRTKEAAQLGAYAGAISGLNGYYLDHAGREQTTKVDGCAVVTFAPDGSYGIHRTTYSVAVSAWDAANYMRRFVPVGELYAKAVKGALDVPATVGARLATIPDGAPERMALAQEWTRHRLPRVADLTLDDYPTADRLLTQYEPFPIDNTPATEYASDTACAAMLTRVKALPADLRAAIDTLPDLLSPTLTTVTLEDYERHVGMAEATVAHRVGQAELLCDWLTEDQRAAIGDLLGPPERWTDADLDRCAELVAAIEAGAITVAGSVLAVANTNLPKRETTAKAKEVAESIGRPRPKRFDDVTADVVLYAAVLAA